MFVLKMDNLGFGIANKMTSAAHSPTPLSTAAAPTGRARDRLDGSNARRSSFYVRLRRRTVV